MLLRWTRVDVNRGPSTDGDDARQRRPARRRSARAVFGRLLENGAVPKLIVLCVCLCGVYVVLRLSVDVLDVRRLASLGAFAVYVDGVAALVNATNADALGTAAAYNGVVMPAFSAVTHAQIANLHHLIDHFNRGSLALYKSVCVCAAFCSYFIGSICGGFVVQLVV